MRTGIFCFVTVLLCSTSQQALSQPAQPGPPAATEQAAPHIVPMWRSRATGEDMRRVYPRQALSKRQAGIAMVRCEVTSDGEMANCAVEQEAPTGLGFGEAALKLMPRFKMRPTTADGLSVEGGVVRLPIQFRLPGG